MTNTDSNGGPDSYNRRFAHTAVTRATFLRCFVGFGAACAVLGGMGACAPAPAETPTSPSKPAAAAPSTTSPKPAAAVPSTTSAPKPAAAAPSTAVPSAATGTAAPLAAFKFIQGSSSLGWASVELADMAGYLKQEGLAFDVSLQGNGGPTANLGAVVNHSVAAGGSTAPNLITVRSNGQPIRIIGALQNQYTVNLVLRKDVAKRLGITETDPVQKRVDALRGLSIGTVSIGGGDFLALQYALLQRGMDLNRDATVTGISPFEATVTALKLGRIDAANLTIPYDQQAIADGTAISLLSTSRGELPGLNDLIFTCIYSTDSYLTDKKQEDLLLRFLRGITRAQQVLAKSPMEAENILQPAFKEMDQSVFHQSLTSNLSSFNRTPMITEQQFNNTKKFQESLSKTTYNVKFADLIDNSLAQRVVSELGAS